MSEEIVDFLCWQKLDLRVGRILEVEDVKGADKLYKLTVDIGNEIGKRILVAGLKEYYSKKELNGKKCIVFINLEPKILKGIESQGMILAAVSEDEKKVILVKPKYEVNEGIKIEFKNG